MTTTNMEHSVMKRIALKLFVALLVMLLTIGVVNMAKAHADSNRGDRGPEVVKIQYVLISHGYASLVGPMGYFGPKTEKAVRHWQKINGLTVDGIVGPDTLASLGLDGATATAPATRLNPPAPQPCDVPCIIRDVWPDDLEDHAIDIAWRESNWQPGVRNACCFGLFQLYWNVHKGWMGDFGVTSSSQLFDARTNAEMAYQMYLRAGGWGPWRL